MSDEWRFVRFGLLVTGRGEESFLPKLFRSLAATGHCTFEVAGRIPQLSPVRSAVRRLKIEHRGIPTKDEEIGLAARRYLQRGDNHFVVLIDDLEAGRAAEMEAVFRRYRTAIDTLLGPLGWSSRASVHFFVNMLEAYYFADVDATNSVLGTQLVHDAGDVEAIRHPKNLLNQACPHFDEVKHGEEIVARLNLKTVLLQPGACASLRSLIAWCHKAMGEPFADDYCLANGVLHPVTHSQAEALGPILPT